MQRCRAQRTELVGAIDFDLYVSANTVEVVLYPLDAEGQPVADRLRLYETKKLISILHHEVHTTVTVDIGRSKKTGRRVAAKVNV